MRSNFVNVNSVVNIRNSGTWESFFIIAGNTEVASPLCAAKTALTCQGMDSSEGVLWFLNQDISIRSFKA